jgi:hypothetical protein
VLGDFRPIWLIALVGAPCSSLLLATTLAVAVAGVFTCQVLSLCVPMPFSLAFLPTLRVMGEHRDQGVLRYDGPGAPRARMSRHPVRSE